MLEVRYNESIVSMHLTAKDAAAEPLKIRLRCAQKAWQKRERSDLGGLSWRMNRGRK